MYFCNNLILLVIFLISCREVKEGQIQPLLSYSGKYSVEMPILEYNEELDYPVWTPTIKDINGEILYQDRSSTLSGYHNSYWDWSEEDDILWVYNSDNGMVFIYSINIDLWEKNIYDSDKDKLIPPEIISNKINRD